ncbi:MAG: glycosyltransferase, partial [Planctomycetota bacterium]
MSRIVMATFGSYGDVFPYLALGRELRARGHQPVLATAEAYRGHAEKSGIEFRPMRPNVSLDDRKLITRCMDPKRGAQVIVTEIVVPALRDSYADLEAATEGADLLLSHVLTYAAPILGEKKKLPWMATVLSPMVFCSAYEPPAFAPIPWLASLGPMGPGFNGFLLRVLKRISKSWSDPIRAFRAELDLPDTGDPMFEGQFSPHGNMALFSELFGASQRDWPSPTITCGFPFHDEDFGPPDPDLEAFLEAGSRPVVFTLGSAAVQVLGTFWEEALKAIRATGRRAVFVAGPEVGKFAAGGETIMAVREAPFHRLFPRASAVVHPGGVGTTAQALRAGAAQVVVPFSNDQFDNGNRVEHMRCGVRLRGQVTGESRAAALESASGD